MIIASNPAIETATPTLDGNFICILSIAITPEKVWRPRRLVESGLAEAKEGGREEAEEQDG